MIDDSSNNGLEATTLSSNHYRWLAPNSWGDDEIIHFAKHRGAECLQIFNGQNFFEKTQAPHLHTVARWTLNRQGEEQNIFAWAELQELEGPFTQGFLFVGGCDDGKEEALALCLGACLIMGEFDQLRLISTSPLTAEMLSWGERKSLYSLRADAIFSREQPLTYLECVDIFPKQWWATEMGKKMQRELNYLRLRLKRRKKDSNCRCRNR